MIESNIINNVIVQRNTFTRKKVVHAGEVSKSEVKRRNGWGRKCLSLL